MDKVNGELKIESGIPLPKEREHKGYSATLRKLNVGDSILFPDPISHAVVAPRCSAALGQGNYVSRKVEGGIRVWRTK